MSSHKWKLKNNEEVCLLTLNKSSETVCGSILLRMARIEMDVVLRNFSQFFKALVSIFKGKQLMCHGLLFLKKVDWSLSLKFLGNGPGKALKEGFLYGFGQENTKVHEQSSFKKSSSQSSCWANTPILRSIKKVSNYCQKKCAFVQACAFVRCVCNMRVWNIPKKFSVALKLKNTNWFDGFFSFPSGRSGLRCFISLLCIMSIRLFFKESTPR